MVFGKREYYNDNMIEYVESVEMLLNDLRMMGHKDLTKEELLDVFNSNFSIGRIVRLEISERLKYNKMPKGDNIN